MISLKFSNMDEFNDEVREIWINTLNYAVKCARGDYESLRELRMMLLEALALCDNYESEIWERNNFKC